MRPLGLRGLPVALLASLAAGVSPAVPAVSAASIQVARDYLIDGPQLAGGQVLYMTGWRDVGYALWQAGAGTSPRIIATGGRPGGTPYREYSFDAAARRIGVMRSRISPRWDGSDDPSAESFVEYHRSRLLVGESPQALTRIAECSGHGTFFPYSAGDDFVAFVDDCPDNEVDPSSGRYLGYFDFSDGTARRRTVTLPPGRFTTDEYADGLAVAGRWAAVDVSTPTAEPPPATVVIDLAAGQEAFRVERPDGWALDADGTLVTVSGATTKCRGRLAFHTPAEPAPHPLPYEACTADLEIDAGSFLFIGEVAGRRTLMLGHLDGNAPRPLAHADIPWMDSFDIEGDRAVFELVTCGAATSMHVTGLDESDLRPRGDGRCPVRLVSRRTLVRPGGRVTVRLRCPRGCEVRGDLRGPSQARGGRRFRSSLAGTGVRSRGPTATLRFEIPPRVRARLPRGALRARLELFSRNLLGAIPDTVIRAPIRLRVR